MNWKIPKNRMFLKGLTVSQAAGNMTWGINNHSTCSSVSWDHCRSLKVVAIEKIMAFKFVDMQIFAKTYASLGLNADILRNERRCTGDERATKFNCIGLLTWMD